MKEIPFEGIDYHIILPFDGEPIITHKPSTKLNLTSWTILNALHDQEEPMTVQDIVRVTELSQSTIYYSINQMVKRRLIKKAGELRYITREGINLMSGLVETSNK